MPASCCASTRRHERLHVSGALGNGPLLERQRARSAADPFVQTIARRLRYEPCVAAADSGTPTRLNVVLMEAANCGESATTAVAMSPDIKAYSIKSWPAKSCQSRILQIKLVNRSITRSWELRISAPRTSLRPLRELRQLGKQPTVICGHMTYSFFGIRNGSSSSKELRLIVGPNATHPDVPVAHSSAMILKS